MAPGFGVQLHALEAGDGVGAAGAVSDPRSPRTAFNGGASKSMTGGRHDPGVGEEVGWLDGTPAGRVGSAEGVVSTGLEEGSGAGCGGAGAATGADDWGMPMAWPARFTALSDVGTVCWMELAPAGEFPGVPPVDGGKFRVVGLRGPEIAPVASTLLRPTGPET